MSASRLRSDSASADTLIDEALAMAGPESLLGPVPPVRPGSYLSEARTQVQPVVARYLFATLSMIGAAGALVASQLSPGLP